MKKFGHSLSGQILVAMDLGILVGALGGPRVAGIRVVGDLFLRLLQLAVLPLILGSVIAALGDLPAERLRRVGLALFGWFLATTLAAAAFGLAIAWWLKPGRGLGGLLAKASGPAARTPGVSATILEFVPQNVFGALAKGNPVQVIVFALLFGYVLSRANRKGDYQGLLDGLHRLNRLFLAMVNLVLKLAPLGIFGLLVGTTAKHGLRVLVPLARFLFAQGLASLLFLALLLGMVRLRTGRSWPDLARGFARMILMAATTTSSAATLPVEMEDAKHRLGVPADLVNLGLPLGMTLNSNGLALYLAIACVTISQLAGMILSPLEMVRVVLLATLACLGTVVVPGGGLVALTIVLPSMGLPVSSVALLAGVDWFAGSLRTILNVVGDTTTVMMIAANKEREP